MLEDEVSQSSSGESDSNSDQGDVKSENSFEEEEEGTVSDEDVVAGGEVENQVIELDEVKPIESLLQSGEGRSSPLRALFGGKRSSNEYKSMNELLNAEDVSPEDIDYDQLLRSSHFEVYGGPCLKHGRGIISWRSRYATLYVGPTEGKLTLYLREDRRIRRNDFPLNTSSAVRICRKNVGKPFVLEIYDVFRSNEVNLLLAFRSSDDLYLWRKIIRGHIMRFKDNAGVKCKEAPVDPPCIWFNTVIDSKYSIGSSGELVWDNYKLFKLLETISEAEISENYIDKGKLSGEERKSNFMALFSAVSAALGKENTFIEDPEDIYKEIMIELIFTYTCNRKMSYFLRELFNHFVMDKMTYENEKGQAALLSWFHENVPRIEVSSPRIEGINAESLDYLFKSYRFGAMLIPRTERTKPSEVFDMGTLDFDIPRLINADEYTENFCEEDWKIYLYCVFEKMKPLSKVESYLFRDGEVVEDVYEEEEWEIDLRKSILSGERLKEQQQESSQQHESLSSPDFSNEEGGHTASHSTKIEDGDSPTMNVDFEVSPELKKISDEESPGFDGESDFDRSPRMKKIDDRASPLFFTNEDGDSADIAAIDDIMVLPPVTLDK